jgi:hypothetical protein
VRDDAAAQALAESERRLALFARFGFGLLAVGFFAQAAATVCDALR